MDADQDDQLSEGIAQGWITPAVQAQSLRSPKRVSSAESIVAVLERDRSD